MDITKEADEWIVRIPVMSSYPVREAAILLERTDRAVEAALKEGGSLYPPLCGGVEHRILVGVLEARARRKAIKAARQEVLRRLEEACLR